METKDMQRSPARVTVADDFSLKIPIGYRYAASGEIPRPRKELRERENTAPLLTLRSEDGAENWEFSVWDIKFHESEDLQRYEKRVKMELLFIEPLFSGDKSREFELRRESDICVYCELEDYDGDEENPDRAVYDFQIFTLKRVYHGTARFEGKRSRAENQERLGRVLGRIASRAEQEPPKYLEKFMALNEELPIVRPEDDRIVNAYENMYLPGRQRSLQRLRGGTNVYDCVEYGMKKIGDGSDSQIYFMPSPDDEPAKAQPFDLSEKAWELAEVFRVDSGHYDPEADREAEIQQGFLREVDAVHVFRTFAWLVAEYCKRHKTKRRALDLDTVLALAQLAGSRHLCYDESHCCALCGKPDIHVVYENAVVGFDEFGQMEDIAALRRVLRDLYPCVAKIADYLKERRKDKTVQLRGCLSDILYVWCSITIAANRPFYVTPDVPMNYYYEEILTYEEYLRLDSPNSPDDEDDDDGEEDDEEEEEDDGDDGDDDEEEDDDEDEDDGSSFGDFLGQALAQALLRGLMGGITIDDSDEEEDGGEDAAAPSVFGITGSGRIVSYNELAGNDEDEEDE